MRIGPIVVGLVVVLATALSGGALAGAGTGSDAADVATETPTATPTPTPAANETNDSTGESFGSQLSAYVQSEAAEAEGAVEQGMWEAEFDRRGTAAVVSQRGDAIAEQLAALAERRQALTQARENGSISETKYRAELAAVEARLASLERAANRTVPAAQAVGANESRFRALGAAASDQRRATAAQRGGPSDRPGDAPGNAPGGSNASDRGKGNDGAAGDAGNRTTETPAGEGKGQGNSSGNGDGAGSGNGDGAGSGNGDGSDGGDGPPQVGESSGAGAAAPPNSPDGAGSPG